MSASEGRGGAVAGLLLVLLLGGACGAPACVDGGDRPDGSSAEQQAVDLAREQLLSSWRAEGPGQEVDPQGWRVPASAAWQEELGLPAFRAVAAGLRDRPEEEGWSWLVAIASRWPRQTGLTAAQARALLAPHEPAGEGVEAAAWRAARAWSSLSQGQPEEALRQLGSPSSVDLLGLSARLRALQELAMDPQQAALALHRAFPADREGCRAAGREARRRQDLAELEEVMEACLDASSTPYLRRLLADVLDARGRSAEACALYLEAGAELHAAAILVQDGRCAAPPPADLVPRALAEDSAEARLHTLWAALLAGERGAIEPAASAMLARGEDRGPPARAALAAAWIALDQPFAAGVLLDEGAGSSAPVLILRARVAQAAGQPEVALRLADEAVAAAPDEPEAHRARMRLRAALDTSLLPAAVDEIAAQGDLVHRVDRMLPWRAVAPGGWPLEALDRPSRERLEAALASSPLEAASGE
jgi:tetratricopeptide (TPR) repeat protein